MPRYMYIKLVFQLAAISNIQLKALFNNVFTLNKIWAAWSYMLSMSLVRCKNEDLKNCTSISEIRQVTTFTILISPHRLLCYNKCLLTLLNIIIQYRHQSSTIILNRSSTMLNNVCHAGWLSPEQLFHALFNMICLHKNMSLGIAVEIIIVSLLVSEILNKTGQSSMAAILKSNLAVNVAHKCFPINCINQHG